MPSNSNKEKIEINLKLIADAAEPNWEDNWNFRSYLIQNIDSTSVDQKVFALYKEVSSKIDCTSCGNCCREIHPFISKDEIRLLAQGLSISETELLNQTKPEDGGCVSFCQKPCPMLNDKKCTVYQFRPVDCRDYPHLDKPDFLAGSIGTIENYGTCPIIYNVYNQLKMAFDYDPSIDYIGDSDPEAVYGTKHR